MKGIAYGAEETDMDKVVILVFGNTLSFIGYRIATKPSIEITMTIQIEAGADIWYKLSERICKKFLQKVCRSIYSLRCEQERWMASQVSGVTSRSAMAILRIKI